MRQRNEFWRGSGLPLEEDARRRRHTLMTPAGESGFVHAQERSIAVGELPRECGKLGKELCGFGTECCRPELTLGAYTSGIQFEKCGLIGMKFQAQLLSVIAGCGLAAVWRAKKKQAISTLRHASCRDGS